MSAELLSDIESFMARHQMSATRFGQLATGDRHLVYQLRGSYATKAANRGKPRRVWPETEAKIRDFMARHDAGAVAGTEAAA